MRRCLVGLSVALLLASFALAQQKPKKKPNPAPKAPPADTGPVAAALPSEETVNSFMQYMFGYDSSVTWKISDIRPAIAESLAQVTVVVSNSQGQQISVLYVTPDGAHALVGDLIPFGAQPFAPAQQKLIAGVNGVPRGPDNAPVTIVEFSDFQCPHCKVAQPTVEKLLTDEPNVHFVFQQFPLPIHEWSNKAAAYADCVGRANNGAFWKFVDAIFNAQTDITAANADEKLTGFADGAGVKGADIAACAVKPETQTRIDASIALGKSVDVTGTPTLFINGRKISNINGLPYDLLKKLVEFAAKPSE
jgi:protein-disulfide isomerase